MRVVVAPLGTGKCVRVCDTGLSSRCGAVCLLLVWVLWDCTVDAETRPFPDQAEEQLQAVVPVYRFMGCLILLVWCWGFNVWVWTKARINYMYAAPPCGACVCMCVCWRHASRCAVAHQVLV